MTREALIEVMARAMAPRCWEVMDAELNRMLQRYKRQNVTYPSDQFQHKESMAAARKALSALEVAGVRLVPVDPDDKMLAAGMECDSIAHPWEALGVYRQMLAASPYALKETGQ